MAKPRTLYDKIWDDHLVDQQPDGTCLLYIDRHLVHEVTSPQAFEGLRTSGRKVRAPEKTLAVVDHNIPTSDRNLPNPDPESAEQIRVMAENASEFGIEYFDEHDRRQGIVHVIGPEQGFTLPGTTIVCGDSHTSTHGAFGALAHGIGTSEVEHVLATQTLIQKKAKNMRAVVDGKLPPGVTAQGHHPVDHRRDRHRGRHRLRDRICRRGDPRALDGRPHDGLQHVDRGRRARRHGGARREDLRIPQGPAEDAEGRRVGNGHALLGDAAARTRARNSTARSGSMPRSCRRSSPGAPIPSRSPRSPAACRRSRKSPTRTSARRSSARSPTWDFKGGEKITDIALDRVFIGSCTNGRIEDLRDVARVANGHKVNANVYAMIVPGSGIVKEQAEAEGLDKIFKAAGFDWREPGCSMCLAMNPDKLKPGERCASTSNRNFEGRQGYKGRTHLVSPAMAAAAAIAGKFVDVREWK